MLIAFKTIEGVQAWVNPLDVSSIHQNWRGEAVVCVRKATYVLDAKASDVAAIVNEHCDRPNPAARSSESTEATTPVP